jgi:putative transposase
MRRCGVRRVYRYRLYPTVAQDRALRGTLDLLRELYNAALQERRDAYRATGRSPSCYTQQKSLLEVRALRPEFADVHTHLLQDALTRLDRAFQAFFRRCKAGEEPGYPRFRGRGRYSTFTFKDATHGNGAKLCAGDKRLSLTGIGKVKIKLHRPYEGRLKQISVTLDSDGHWYAALVCDDVLPKPLPATGREVGIDLGITEFATFSEGSEPIHNPRPLQRAQARVAKAQRRVSRRKRGSHRRRKARLLLAKQHARVRNVRKDFHHKTALDLVRRYDRIVLEDLNVQGLARGMLATQVRDAAWAEFTTILAAKAACAGRELVQVDPRGTSQHCSECGAYVPKTLAVRVHHCPHCGYVADRDLNAARNIHRRGSRRERGVEGYAEDLRSLPLGR